MKISMNRDRWTAVIFFVGIITVFALHKWVWKDADGWMQLWYLWWGIFVGWHWRKP